MRLTFKELLKVSLEGHSFLLCPLVNTKEMKIFDIVTKERRTVELERIIRYDEVVTCVKDSLYVGVGGGY